jgi:inorganic pyrophosphatase
MSDSTNLSTTSYNPSTYFAMNWTVYFILAVSIASIAWGVVNYFMINSIVYEEKPIIDLLKEEKEEDNESVADEDVKAEAQEIIKKLEEINKLIVDGAEQFLRAEYIYLSLFCCVFALVIGFTVDATEISKKKEDSPSNFPYTAISFLVGALTSIASGYIGMKIAVFTNARTTYNCCLGDPVKCAVPKPNAGEDYVNDLHEFFYPPLENQTDEQKKARKNKDVTVSTLWEDGTEKDLKIGFLTAFRGGQVLGFCLVGLALLILTILNLVYKAAWLDKMMAARSGNEMNIQETRKFTMDLIRRHFEFVAGYGLGGSTVALFGRVGGGIYTKAADVGADLVGKVRADLAEDSPENPGTIADNVGDNVGDIAGMGADLFGSLAESTCAALVVSSTSWELIT